MGVEIALVADDLTGALDAAAPFAARGLRVRVFRKVDAVPDAPATAADEPEPGAQAGSPVTVRPRDGGSVLAVSTSSRHLEPAAARAAVAAVGRRLRAWSPRLAFKKIDSTLRGPVVDEVAAAMEAFGRPSALVSPAFPAAGRVVRDGEVFVHGERLAETEYARDLRTPAPRESLAVLFSRIGTVRRLPAGPASRDRFLPGITVADASSASELAGLGALVVRQAKEVLAVGSDGLAAGLSGFLGRPAPRVGIGGQGADRVLYALGSRTATTAEQIERLIGANPGTTIVDAPAGALDPEAVLRALDSARLAVARVPELPRGEPGEIARAFAAGVRVVVEHRRGGDGLAALVASGGDTVDEILDAFGIAALDVLGEFRPGIPISRAEGFDLTLVSKAGGFGTPALFVEIAAETAG